MSAELSLFSEDYQTARSRFCKAALHAGWDVQSHPRGGGREGELFTDFTRIGSVEPRKLLVVTSALHGVEGFLGSAIQLHGLQSIDIQHVTEAGTAILMVHGLNPFGFARLRRFDENNVDVNRNFLLPGEEYTGAHPLYQCLDNFLNPKRWPKWELPPLLQAFMKIIPIGLNNLQRAIAEGQYDFPLGIFFGGHQQSETAKFCQDKLLPELQSAEVLHLDIHSGLGKSAQAELLFDYPLQQSEELLMTKMFEGQVCLQQIGKHYQARGSFSRWVRKNTPNTISACWEFGTFHPVKVLLALRAENAANHWGDRISHNFQATKAKLKESFTPKSASWRSAVMKNAQQQLNNVIHKWLVE